MEGRKLSPNLKKELEEEMNRNAARNELVIRGRFVSDGFVEELLQEENLEAHLRSEYNQWSWPLPLPREYRRLSTAIRTDGQILYCILILLDRQKDIQALLFKEPAVNDRTLFGRDHTGHRRSCSREELRKIPQFDDTAAEEFYQKQWSFPPTLYTTDGIPEFDLQHFKMPFDQKSEFIASGTFGAVYKTEIRKEFLRPREDSSSILSVAYKKIVLRYTDPKKRKRVYNEVTVLRDRAHPSVTELLGSFISGLEIQGAGGAAQECLYIVYPRAETDMDKWLKSKPDQFLASIGEGQKLDRHLYSAMLGLASGMAWLHCEIDGQAGYHRDLKPPNVLLFRDREWTWKIADFGTANVKPIEDTGTKSLTSTKYWSPPEFFEDNGEQDNKTHGRPHDVYSLGCIFAVIATVIVHRWNDAGLPRFERRRCSRKPLDSPDEEQFENESGAFHKCEDAVLEWIQELEETYPDKEKLTAVLKVVKEMLLPYEKRISAWEVDVYLYEATEEWRSEIKDPVPGDLSMAKHDMVVKRLRAVAQESREIDLHKKRTPVSRARDWKRSNDFLLALEEKKWIESSPQMSEDLKRRRELPRGSVEIVSTLPPDTSKKDPIFGYQKEFDGIARGFGQHNIVVLWGLGGIGKSRMALFYAYQFAKANSPERKHTFWISMASSDTIHEGYKRIADKIRAPQHILAGTDEKVAEYVERWLQDDKSEAWILVLDGLDTVSDMGNTIAHQRDLLDLEKIHRHGQILITARSRACVKVLHGQYERLQLTPPGLDDCLRIYDRFIDKSLFPVVDQNTKDLLDALSLPKLIKEAVDYMNSNMIPPSVLWENINSEEFRGVYEFSPDILNHLLNHLPEGTSRPDYSRIEIQKLFILAMFGEGASYGLLRSELDEKELPRLLPALGVLQNSSLVILDKEVYRVEKTVQAVLWAHIDREEGGLGFLQRFNKMLSMMYAYYRQSTCRDGFMTFMVNQNLALNFERILKFAKKRPREYPYKTGIATSSVLAIIEFARALCDQDRYDDATKILDFARDHYLVDHDSREEKRKRFVIRYKLDQQIMKTYLSRPSEKSSYSINPYWKAAETIVTNQIEEAKSWKDTADHNFENQMRKWDLSLDLVRVRYYLKQWAEAEKELDSLDEINITISHGEAILDDHVDLRSGIKGTQSDQIQIEEKRRAEFRHIAVRKAWVEGLFHLEKGHHAEVRGDKLGAKKSWESAKKALDVAEIALGSWEPKSETRAEVLVNIADVDTKLGTKKGLEQALKTFEDTLKEIEIRYGSNCMRAWDMKCRINAVRLKTGRNLDKVVSSLESLLGHYEARFGGQAAPTVRCAHQLMEAYAKTNRWRDAEMLSTRTQVRPRLEVDRSETWVVSGAVAVVVCGLCSLWVMRRGNALRMWINQGTGVGP